jgi:hypothetical protein
MNFNVGNENHPFFMLPYELQLECLSYLAEGELPSRVSLLCKAFLNLARHEAQWKERTIRQLGEEKGNQFFEKFISWQNACLKFLKMSKEGEVLCSEGIILMGDKRSGQFRNGKLNGQGKKISPNGTTWEGEFKEDELIKGRKIGRDETLEGDFQDGKLNGQGKVVFFDGETWEGTFKEGLLHGEGKIAFRNGETREGTFQDDRLNGQGKITKANGEVWEGTFQYDRLHGCGKKTMPNGQVFQGNFRNGQFS